MTGMSPRMSRYCLGLLMLLFLISFSSRLYAQGDWPVTTLDLEGTYPTNYLTWTSAVPCGDRRLMVSDSPETLNEADVTSGHVLWHDAVTRATGDTVAHRVFFWHVNASNQLARIGITIQNSSDVGILVQHCRGNFVYGDLNADLLGTQCKSLAEATLTGLAPITDALTVPPHAVAVIYANDAVEIGYLFGATVEFDITGTAPLNYEVRTVACTTEQDLTAFTGPVIPSTVHNRGSWEHDGILGEIAPCRFTGETFRVLVTQRCGADQLYRKDNSFDSENAVGNAGNYGVTYYLQLNFENDSDAPQILDAYINAQGTGFTDVPCDLSGQPYAGASSYCVEHGISVIRSTGPNAAGPFISTELPAKTSQTHALTLVHAGEATLPIGLYFRWLRPRYYWGIEQEGVVPWFRSRLF